MSNNDKPIFLYVSPNSISEINLYEHDPNMERTIDVELTEQDAKKLRDLLQSKLNVEVFGAVTFRLRGRLIL